LSCVNKINFKIVFLFNSLTVYTVKTNDPIQHELLKEATVVACADQAIKDFEAPTLAINQFHKPFEPSRASYKF